MYSETECGVWPAVDGKLNYLSERVMDQSS